MVGDRHESVGVPTARNGATLGFENKLWAAADKLRGHMDAAEYKHVILGSARLEQAIRRNLKELGYGH